MSDSIINIRFLFWNFKVQQDTNKISLNFNQYHLKNKFKAIIMPIEIYEWDLK